MTVTLGDGFDSVQRCFKKTLLTSSSVASASGVTSPAPGLISFRFFEDFKALKSHLESNQLSALGGLMQKSESDGQGGSKASEEKVHLYHLFYYERAEGSVSLDLNQCQRKDLGAVSSQSFLQEYGDRFVTEIAYGKQLAIVLHYTFDKKDYEPKSKAALEHFCRDDFNTEHLDRGLRKLLEQQQVQWQLYASVQAASTSFLVDDLKQLRVKAQELMAEVNGLGSRVVLSYQTSPYTVLDPSSSLFMSFVQEKNQVIQAAAKQLEAGEKLLANYQDLVKNELTEHSGSPLLKWQERGHALNAVGSQMAALERQLQAGTFQGNMAQSIQQLNTTFEQLNVRTQSIDRSQEQTVMKARVFNQKDGFKYHSVSFQLNLAPDAQWVAFQFENKDLSVGLQHIALFSKKRDLLINIVPNKKYQGEELKLLQEYAKKHSNFRFKIKNINGEPFVLDKNMEIVVTCGKHLSCESSNVSPLVWEVLESPRLLTLPAQSVLPAQPVVTSPVSSDAEAQQFSDSLEATLAQVRAVALQSLQSSPQQGSEEAEVRQEAELILQLLDSIAQANASQQPSAPSPSTVIVPALAATAAPILHQHKPLSLAAASSPTVSSGRPPVIPPRTAPIYPPLSQRLP